MKKVFLSLIPLLFILTAKAQTTDTAKTISQNKSTINERAPEYPGGFGELYKFLMKYMRYPELAKQNGTEGRVIVSFVVDKDGSLTDVKVVRGIGDNCDEEAVRLVKLSSPWKPGVQNGHTVRCAYTIPIAFNL